MRESIKESGKTFPNIKVLEQNAFIGQTVIRVWRFISRKGILFLYDNARPHKARTSQGLVNIFGWEVC